jgi:hypothetical protein
MAKQAFPGKVIHIFPPTKEGSYDEKIGVEVCKAYKNALSASADGEDPSSFLDITFIIDEAHNLVEEGSFNFEGVQHGQVHTSFGGVPVLFRQLVFMSYGKILENASENARVLSFDLGSPDREYMIQALEGKEAYEGAGWHLSKPLLKVAAEYSPRNMHVVVNNAIALTEGRAQILRKYGVEGPTREILSLVNGKRQISKIRAEIGVAKQEYDSYEEPLWFDQLIGLSSEKGKSSIRILKKAGAAVLKAKPRDARKGLTLREKARIQSWERRWAKAQAEE